MEINGYVLENEDKLYRALNGSVAGKGKLSGGVGDEAPPEAVLAEYDRLGGLITKDGLKVKTGSFYSFEEKKARQEPEVVFEAILEGKPVEVTEAEAKALEAVKKKKQALKEKAKAKKKVRQLPKKKVQLKDLD